jgi:hypothetical protein
MEAWGSLSRDDGGRTLAAADCAAGETRELLGSAFDDAGHDGREEDLGVI